MQTACSVLCLFYVLGIFNTLVLEALHQVSHVFAPETHHHSFFSNHESIDYASLEAMAGHSHEALEDLKILLEANLPDKKEAENTLHFKFHKHLQAQNNFEPFIASFKDIKTQWHFFSTVCNGFPQSHFPPPEKA